MPEKQTGQPTKFCMKCGESVAATNDRCPTDGFRLVSTGTDSMVGSVIQERYVLESVVGTGGWATVYLAQDKTLKRRVAIKVMHAVHVVEYQRIARFTREAQAVAHMQHRNICDIFDFGFLSHGRPYIVMEYLDGRALSRVLYDKKTLPADQAIEIAMQACDALGHAHKRGIIHRDIKPGNIMVLDDGRIKLLDFGLAKITFDKEERNLTATGVTVGTAEYMSPEQCHGLPVTATTDIYALGCVLFEMLTGGPPFEADSDLDYMTKHVNEKAPTLQSRAADRHFSAKLEAVVARALEKSPHQRFDDAYALKIQLQAATSKRPRVAIPSAGTAAQAINKSYVVMSLVALALIAAAIAAIFMMR